MRTLVLSAVALSLALVGAGPLRAADENQVFTIGTALRGGIY